MSNRISVNELIRQTRLNDNGFSLDTDKLLGELKKYGEETASELLKSGKEKAVEEIKKQFDWQTDPKQGGDGTIIDYPDIKIDPGKREYPIVGVEPMYPTPDNTTDTYSSIMSAVKPWKKPAMVIGAGVLTKVLGASWILAGVASAATWLIVNKVENE